MARTRFLSRFSDRLNAQEHTFGGIPIHATETIVQAKEVIFVQLRELGPPVPSDEVVMMALRTFLVWSSAKRNDPLSWMETALVCWGLLTPISSLREKTILESTPHFDGLLRLLESQRDVGNVTPYLWRGLLNAYLAFRFDKNESASVNWEALRTYLSKTLPVLYSSTQIKPVWLEALHETHRSILDKAPFARYRLEVFADHCPMVASLNEQLDVPETSWFWPGLLLQGIRDLAAGADKIFKPRIDIVLVRLKDHESCHDDGLALILDRYAQCESAEPHEGLKFHAVARWHSPTLGKQRNWERVRPETKRMIQRWLVLEDLRDFFKTLHADDGMNRRRYEFWMQFLDQMSYVHLVLGKHARETYPKLLGNKIGRYSELKGASATNNAFIMRIGNFFFVEFGEVGKCWGYEESTAKNLIPTTSYVGSISYHDLRAAGHSVLINSMGHRDGLAHQGDWEYRFGQAFSRLGINPDPMSLKEVTGRYQLPVLDRRKEGGGFWVRHDQGSGTVADYLRNASFIYKNKSEGFFATGHKIRWDK